MVRRGSGVRVPASALSGSAAANLRQLRPHHPELLFEGPDYVDEHVLRRGVQLPKPVHARARALACLAEAANQLAHDDLILDGTGLDSQMLGPGGDRVGLAVGPDADRDGALGDGVGELAPAVDQLVKLPVEGYEQRARNAPMELLAEQRQVDELQERCLKLSADLVALVRAEGRQVGGGGAICDGYRFSSSGRSE
jgi:hypothetical protein